jgi:hypothetical protein
VGGDALARAPSAHQVAREPVPSRKISAVRGSVKGTIFPRDNRGQGAPDNQVSFR